jgi:glycine C-acetyltransferase
LIDLLRQRARPYLFSNALPPPICAATLAALDLLENQPALLAQLRANAAFFRDRMAAAGFTLAGAGHPIIPVMLGDARLASRIAARMGELGVYVTAFSFPVVPRGQARIRTQMSAAHTQADLARAVEAFAVAGRECGALCG